MYFLTILFFLVNHENKHAPLIASRKRTYNIISPKMSSKFAATENSDNGTNSLHISRSVVYIIYILKFV